MKQIKTIYKDINPRLSPAGAAQEFDDEVNAALAEGWTLAKRAVLDPHVGEIYDYNRTFYAELEREIVEERYSSHSCLTCKHRAKRTNESPCCGCFDAKNWEPRV